MLTTKKATTVLESRKMVSNEKEEGSTKQSIKLRLKFVQYCIQLTIAKNKFVQNTSNFFAR